MHKSHYGSIDELTLLNNNANSISKVTVKMLQIFKFLATGRTQVLEMIVCLNKSRDCICWNTKKDVKASLRSEDIYREHSVVCFSLIKLKCHWPSEALNRNENMFRIMEFKLIPSTKKRNVLRSDQRKIR